MEFDFDSDLTGVTIRCKTGLTGAGIITKIYPKTYERIEVTVIIYEVITDFGNTIRLTKRELVNEYEPIAKDIFKLRLERQLDLLQESYKCIGINFDYDFGERL